LWWRQGDWLFYLAFQYMRNTVICQGIAARVKQGVASSGQAAQCVSSARVRACVGVRVCVSDCVLVVL
jgi:aminoglycoside phosphotransferase (APT) family kinase protein